MVTKSFLHLDNLNIYDFFATASSRDSLTVVGKKLFDFIDRGSKILVVTVGDSWTWGADLTQEKLKGIHLDRLADDQYRIEHVYGNVLAKKIGADFLNLGEPGSSNWHIDRKLKEFHQIKHRLSYDRILVFAVFTEVGRDFNSHCDIEIDYRSWLLENIKEPVDYYDFLRFINTQITSSIFTVISEFDHRYQFFFSTNFVDPIGYDLLQSHFVSKTWLEIICEKNKIEYHPNKCYMVFPWVIEKFDSVFDFAPELDRNQWLTWINEIVQAANIRRAVCFQDNINFGPLLHPRALNHACWAEYLHENLHGKI